jgi:opacity protein-like surface antigen
MKKTILLCFLLAGGIANTYAQEIAQPADVGTTPQTTPMFEHQLGVQMNELIKQVFNFSNNTTTTSTNPFLLTYSLTHACSKWGLRLGGGYNQRGFQDNDGVNSRDTRIKEINLRAGLEKTFRLSKKWSAGAGADFVYGNNENETKNEFNSNLGAVFNTKSTIKSIGAGGMAWLRYHITKNILIGTETSFYYREETVATRLTVSDPFGGFVGGFFPETNTETDRSEGVFSVPTVFYLIVKF